MCYTILPLKKNKTDKIVRALFLRLEKSPFRANLISTFDKYGRDIIEVRTVRLRVKKEYCGNHPGFCKASDKKKPIASHLEWNDWVKFHKIVNATLNRLRISAEVWSNPHDIRGKMWIRMNNQPRVRWDWKEEISQYGRAIQIWNPGTPDQFMK